MEELERECTEVLARLVRFDTVNPPGNERPAIEYMEQYLGAAGFRTEVLAAEPDRANLIATLGEEDGGPVLCYLGHVDTVLAHPDEWRHDPWSGEVHDGSLWGRGALDMKSQVAAEAVAGAALARQGWRPSRGALRMVFVSDEETGGDLGAQWLTREHPDKVRCDMLLNEGGGEHFQLADRRRYGVCCAEKGVFRMLLTAHGVAGHASLPRMGDNALLKLGPVLERMATAQPSYDITEAPAALLRGLGVDPGDPAAAVELLRAERPEILALVEPMLGVTLTPTMARASEKINVIPSRATLSIDCRVPPGLGEETARARIAEVLGEAMDGLELNFTEQVVGNASPVESEFMRAIDGWVREHDPGAETVPLILPGFSDSRWFRQAFPECIAYGFFPQRYMSVLETTPLVHSADERIDTRDLGFATRFYADIARTVLGP
jgi:acetylornithine deacetylase/succinyl-diaminopimelate desuccinylase-like protein